MSHILFVATECKALQKGFFNYTYSEYQLVDTSRLELYPHHKTCPYRQLMIHMWCPIQEQNNEQFPLIIFSHGLGGMYNGTSYTWLCEDLARHGYIVVSISHTYACKPVTLLDGSSTDYLFPIPSLHYHKGDFFSKEIETWVSDMQYVLDVCEGYCSDTTSPLYHVCDMSKIGVMGHSFGGSTAMQVCRHDKRVRCIINLDGPLHGANALSPFEKPILCIVGYLEGIRYNAAMSEAFFKAAGWSWYIKGHVLPEIIKLFENIKHDVHLIKMPYITHEMFSDCEISDEKLKPFVLDIDNAHAVMLEHIYAFLNCYLTRVRS